MARIDDFLSVSPPNAGSVSVEQAPQYFYISYSGDQITGMSGPWWKPWERDGNILSIEAEHSIKALEKAYRILRERRKQT